MNRFLLILVGMACLLASCTTSNALKEEVTDFIPADASIAFVFTDSESVRTEMSQHPYSDLLKSSPSFKLFIENDVLKWIPFSQKSMLSVLEKKDSLSFLLATKTTASMLDSIKTATVDSSLVNKKQLYHFQRNNNTYYSHLVDSFLLVSSHQKLLINALSQDVAVPPEIKKLSSLYKPDQVQVFKKASPLLLNNVKPIERERWESYSLLLTPEKLEATGVTFIKDSIPSILWLLKDQRPQALLTSKAVPIETESLKAFSLTDATLFLDKLQLNDSLISAENRVHFDSANEIGFAQMQNGKALIVSSISPDNFEGFYSLSEMNSTSYRDVLLYEDTEISKSIKLFQRIFDVSNCSTFFRLDSFFVFASNETTAKEIISSYQNKQVLASHSILSDDNNAISTTHSFIELATSKNKIASTLAPVLETSLAKAPLSSLQYTIENDFAHLHFTLQNKKEGAKSTPQVFEKASIALSKPLLTQPQFFTNHRTKAKEIVFQDIANTLHLYSYTGKKLWSVLIDGPILGKLHEVDILRNGKKQLAFVTPTAFYVLDRNGNDVAPFPIKFKDKVTQPLAVFDYDNNRKYRFVVTQDDALIMYDVKGKIVKGFTYKKAPSAVVLPPQHIRMGNKDYIIVASKNGKLDILSRTGKTRIPVNNTFNFSELPIEKEGSKFVVITAKNEKKSISTSGKISTQKLNVSPNYHFTIHGNTKVTLDDNLLRINGKLIELPFGIYTTPNVINYKGDAYTAIADAQENKVYLYKGTQLQDGFPVYGAKVTDLTVTNNKILLLVSGQEKEVLLYSF